MRKYLGTNDLLTCLAYSEDNTMSENYSLCILEMFNCRKELSNSWTKNKKNICLVNIYNDVETVNKTFSRFSALYWFTLFFVAK